MTTELGCSPPGGESALLFTMCMALDVQGWYCGLSLNHGLEECREGGSRQHSRSVRHETLVGSIAMPCVEVFACSDAPTESCLRTLPKLINMGD